MSGSQMTHSCNYCGKSISNKDIEGKNVVGIDEGDVFLLKYAHKLCWEKEQIRLNIPIPSEPIEGYRHSLDKIQELILKNILMI